MFAFLLGVVAGVAGTIYYQQGGFGGTGLNPDTLESRFSELQDRANAVLNEARRVLQETRSELESAVETGRTSVAEKADRIRQAAETGAGVEGHGQSGPGQGGQGRGQQGGAT